MAAYMWLHIYIVYKKASMQCYVSSSSTNNQLLLKHIIPATANSTSAFCSCQMANPSFFLTVLALSLSVVLTSATSTLQDFCVADPEEKGTADTCMHMHYCLGILFQNPKFCIFVKKGELYFHSCMFKRTVDLKFMKGEKKSEIIT